MVLPSHDDGRLDIFRQITRLADITDTVERRLLQLVQEGARRVAPLEDYSTELSTLAKEVRRCYREVADLQDRRDLGFREVAELQKVDRHCVWLYRRIHLEQFFFRKWHLETILSALISPEAFDVYEEILNVEEPEKEFLARGDSEIRGLLLEETDAAAGTPSPTEGRRDEK